VKASRAIPLALLLAVVVRLPFWIEALRTPVDGDTAIVGLMARHPGEGTTLWGQPYGSPLDSWVAMPFVVAWGTTTEALRLPSFLLGLLLVPIAYGLGRALHPAAALPAAFLLACPPPYLLLLAALPPPLYATTLVLCGTLLLLALRLGVALEERPGEVHRQVRGAVAYRHGDLQHGLPEIVVGDEEGDGEKGVVAPGVRPRVRGGERVRAERRRAAPA